jgi:hypothetical protein
MTTPPATGIDRFKQRLRGELLTALYTERLPVAPVASRPRPRRLRRLRRLPRPAVVASAAALLAAAIVAVTALAPGGPSIGASAEAASLLSRAAINATDPVLGPRQYLLVTERGMHLGVTQLRDGRYITLRSRGLTQTWIPADPSRQWVRRTTTGPETFLTSEDQRAVQAENGVTKPSVELRRARNGEFYGPVAPSWQTPTRAFIASLPRQPGALLRRIYHDSRGQGSSRDGEALVYVGDLLASAGMVPADLRAALFQAATRIPGIQVTERRANLDGRTGVAVGRYESRTGVRQELIFDPDTGQFIGEREVDVNSRSVAPQAVAPAVVWPDHILSWTSVRATVVDRAP